VAALQLRRYGVMQDELYFTSCLRSDLTSETCALLGHYAASARRKPDIIVTSGFFPLGVATVILQRCIFLSSHLTPYPLIS
jgi:hypothetical protein